MKEIHVVAAIIYSPQRDQILIARRPDHLHQGGYWEFPGGKVDGGESAAAALARELMEELDIRPTDFTPFHRLSHRYPDKAIHLDVWQVHAFTGDPRGVEGQQLAWIAVDDIVQYAFPAANQPVVEMLQSSSKS